MSLFIGLSIVILAGCLPREPEDEVEATSLFGLPLARPKLAAATQTRYEGQLQMAMKDYEADPSSVDKAIWVGRRIAYLGRFRESIKFYSLALERFPENPKLLRHRGHRYLTIRKFGEAARDFEAAVRSMKGQPDEIEPDGQPNERNVPIGSLHSNVWYHLGLAHYLQNDFKRAADAFAECQKTSSNDDRLVSTSYWQALTFARSSDAAGLQATLAPINTSLQVIENENYHDLLLYFKGEKSEEELRKAADAGNAKATLSYGMAAWNLSRGNRTKTIGLLRDILRSQNWTSFGFIAAEADMHRLGLKL